MERSRIRCLVVLPDGPSRRVGASGLLIGRQQDCDIVVTDPSVSRRHALIRLTNEGAEAVPLGRSALEVNGTKHDRAIDLRDGDVLALAGLRVAISLDAQRPDASAPASFRIQRARGGSFGVVHSPFAIGGHEGDDLIIKRWPAHALRLHVAQGELFLELVSGKATRNGIAVEAGALESLAIADVIQYRSEVFTVVAGRHRDVTTMVAALAPLPCRVVVEILPRGGRVTFSMGDGERTVFLADRRLDFLVSLLRPPPGSRAGDFISDDIVRSIVWPRNDGVTRPEINMLISRCRRDLIQAGLSGPRLLERAPGGGGTRLALAPDAEIVFTD